MNYIWGAMVVFSFIAAVFSGNMQTLSDSIVTSGQDAINLILKLTGMMCLWGGIMKIAEKSELTLVISKMLSPLFSVLYRNVDRKSKTAEAMSMNITANLLGLGNAATPLGLEAMKRLQSINGDRDRASDEMVVFVLMNTAAMRIIPTTVATLRGQYGSAEPMSILLPTLLTTASALAVGLSVAKIGCLLKRRAGEKND